MDIESGITGWLEALGPWIDAGAVLLREHATLTSLIAFLIGAAAVLSRARLLVLAVLLRLAGLVAVETGYLAAEPAWLLPVVVVMAALGLAQGALTVAAGEQAASSALLALAIGIAGYLLWRGPARFAAYLTGWGR
jgi:hypothetical protein